MPGIYRYPLGKAASGTEVTTYGNQKRDSIHPRAGRKLFVSFLFALTFPQVSSPSLTGAGAPGGARVLFLLHWLSPTPRVVVPGLPSPLDVVPGLPNPVDIVVVPSFPTLNVDRPTFAVPRRHPWPFHLPRCRPLPTPLMSHPAIAPPQRRLLVASTSHTHPLLRSS